MAVAESVGHQDIGVSFAVVGEAGGTQSFPSKTQESRLWYQRAQGGLSGPRAKPALFHPRRDVGARCSPERSPGLCLSSAPRGAAHGAEFLVPREGQAAGCHAGAFTLCSADNPERKGGVGWGQGTVRSDQLQRWHPRPHPHFLGRQDFPAHTAWVSWQCLRSRVSHGP